MLCVCVAHVVEKAVRDARVAESQAERVAQARVRAARLTDLPFLLAGAAEQGAIAARGDAMVNNNEPRNNNKEGSSELLGPSDAIASQAMAVSTEVACFVIYIYAPLHNL